MLRDTTSRGLYVRRRVWPPHTLVFFWSLEGVHTSHFKWSLALNLLLLLLWSLEGVLSSRSH